MECKRLAGTSRPMTTSGRQKIISLEISESHVSGLMKLVGRFEFLRQHFAFRGPEPAHHTSPLLQSGRAHVDFYDVGKLAPRYSRIVGGEIVEGDEIASRLQTLAGSDDAVFGLHCLQNLGHGLAGGSNVIRSLNSTSRVQFTKARLLSHKDVDAEKQGAIHGGAGGKLGVGVEVVFDTIAEKDLVPEHILRAVKNRLAGNEALAWQRQRIRGRSFFFGRSGLHLLYIGAAGEELQGNSRYLSAGNKRLTNAASCEPLPNECSRFGTHAQPEGCSR